MRPVKLLTERSTIWPSARGSLGRLTESSSAASAASPARSLRWASRRRSIGQGVSWPAMRAVVQRVSRGEVRVDGRPVGAVGTGLVVLLGVARDDSEAAPPEAADALYQRVCALLR